MRVFVRPKQGFVVRHPEKPSYILPSEGCEVEMSVHWKRLIKAGDVELVLASQATKTKGDK